jgi:hypothetical protein
VQPNCLWTEDLRRSQGLLRNAVGRSEARVLAALAIAAYSSVSMLDSVGENIRVQRCRRANKDPRSPSAARG